jgi:hypothetical protein
MNWRMLLTGGFLVGYRTYILGAVAALSAIASWTVGDVATGDMLKAVAEACLGIGLVTLRLGIAGVALPGPSAELSALEPDIPAAPAPINPDIGQIVAWACFDKLKEAHGTYVSDAENEAIAKRIARSVEVRLGLVPSEGLRIHPYPDEREKAILQFFDAWDQALNHSPHLALEVGYNRVTDWVVNVWDTAGVGLFKAPKVIFAQEPSRADALAEATQGLRTLTGSAS